MPHPMPAARAGGCQWCALGFEAGISRGAASQHLSAISTASVSARCDGRRLISCRGGDTQQLAHTARPDPCVEDRRGHQPHNVQTATETPPGRSESGISTLMPAAVAADFHPRKKEEPGLNSPSYLRQACGIWPAIVKRKGNSSCCGGSSRLSLSGFVAAPSSRLFGRSAWRLDGGSGRPRRRFRTWLPNRLSGGLVWLGGQHGTDCVVPGARSTDCRATGRMTRQSPSNVAGDGQHRRLS